MFHLIQMILGDKEVSFPFPTMIDRSESDVIVLDTKFIHSFFLKNSATSNYTSYVMEILIHS